jgi:purine-binding chemotaxis protein CheW
MSGVYVRVRAGGESYALPVSQVLEVTAMDDVRPVPGSSAMVLGVRNLRGQVIPVVDLATVFGIEDEAERHRMVVTGDDDVRLGLAVENVVDVGPLPPPSGAPRSEYQSGAVLVGDEPVGIVDLKGLLEALVAGGVG